MFCVSLPCPYSILWKYLKKYFKRHAWKDETGKLHLHLPLHLPANARIDAKSFYAVVLLSLFLSSFLRSLRRFSRRPRGNEFPRKTFELESDLSPCGIFRTSTAFPTCFPFVKKRSTFCWKRAHRACAHSNGKSAIIILRTELWRKNNR